MIPEILRSAVWIGRMLDVPTRTNTAWLNLVWIIQLKVLALNDYNAATQFL